MFPSWARDLTSVKVRKIFLSAAVVFALLAAAGWAVPIGGPWADFAASKFLTHQTGLPVRCKNTKILRWSKVSFLAVIDRRDLRLMEVFRAARVLSSSPIANGLEGILSVDQLRVGFSGDRSEGLVRILRCESDGLSVRGGWAFKDARLTKAHLYLSLGPARLKKIPPLIRSRLRAVGGGWAAMHIVLCQNQLTFIGHHGPLFQAKWQGNFH